MQPGGVPKRYKATKFPLSLPMGKTNVRVVVRARPTANYASEIFHLNEGSDSIDMRLPKDESAGIVNNQQESWHFKLEKVLANASQEQVFECCAADVVRSVMDGYNGTIMAYGQTGAGKTHTMTGGHVGFADRGIVPRAISLIFAERANRPEFHITIRLSYAECYNELMFDLLSDAGVAEQSGDLAIVEERGAVQIRGLSQTIANTQDEALHHFFQGDTNRRIAEHALNKGSTRSHVVFTIYVESRSRVDSSEKVTMSKLHLVDLAGSERVKKTGSEGVTLKEATYINKSLTFLEQVVVALGNKHRDHVPYRQSKLTHMLKDSLGGNCKTTMIANIWPEANKIEETASTLRFATRMMKVSNEATVNIHLDPQLLIRKYERQIKDLKQELAMHDNLNGRGRVQYDEYSPDEVRELEIKVKMYLQNEVQELEVASYRMTQEAFALFRKLYDQLKTELSQRPAAAAAHPTDLEQGFDGMPAGDATQLGGEGMTGEVVGEDEEGGGLSVGIAPAGSRPPREDRLLPSGGDQGDDMDDRPTETRFPKIAVDCEKAPDKQAAFAEWKTREGQSFEEAFEKNKLELKEKRTEMRQALMTANEKKREIDEAKERLDRKQAEMGHTGSGDDGDPDEEEWALIEVVKKSKADYRKAFDAHRTLKLDVGTIEGMIQQTKGRLVAAFEDYYDSRYGHISKTSEMPVNNTAVRERYDPQESFDLMEAERLETQHPDALAYHKARKNAARDVRHKRTAGLPPLARTR